MSVFKITTYNISFEGPRQLSVLGGPVGQSESPDREAL